MPRYFVHLPPDATDDLVGVPVPDRLVYRSRVDRSVAVLSLDASDVARLGAAGIELHPDFDLDDPDPEGFRLDDPPPTPPTEPRDLDDLLLQIGAPTAWRTSRGKGVTIAFVDSGISGVHAREFPDGRRSAQSFSVAGDDPWTDPVGHGTMCATIAAAGASGPEGFRGVAPEATVLSAKTGASTKASDVWRAYDHLLDGWRSRRISGPLVVSNSRGVRACTPPDIDPEHELARHIRTAVGLGVTVVFAAGNNHKLCNFDVRGCAPGTIWAMGSLDEVVTVGAVDWLDGFGSLDHGGSRRGPGQWATRPKPDCVAPSYGRALWGTVEMYKRCWETSGACAAVAGLAALLLGIDPDLTPEEVGDIVRGSCVELDLAETCVGAGRIDCARAVAHRLDGHVRFASIEARDAYCRREAAWLAGLPGGFTQETDAPVLSFAGVSLAERRRIRARAEPHGSWISADAVS